METRLLCANIFQITFILVGDYNEKKILKRQNGISVWILKEGMCCEKIVLMDTFFALKIN